MATCHTFAEEIHAAINEHGQCSLPKRLVEEIFPSDGPAQGNDISQTPARLSLAQTLLEQQVREFAAKHNYRSEFDLKTGTVSFFKL
jgi:hypothetical protein